MKRMILTLTLLTLAVSQPLRAQQWSAQEQEVLDSLAACWDLWMEGIESGSPEGWIVECTTPGVTFWPAADGAPLGLDFIRRTWGDISGRDLGWADIRPVRLTVEDDFAVLHFYGYWRAETPTGEIVTEAKRTEVFRKIDGRWKLISGHGTPVNPEDAAPYRRVVG